VNLSAAEGYFVGLFVAGIQLRDSKKGFPASVALQQAACLSLNLFR
jgi:hypothetical protein